MRIKAGQRCTNLCNCRQSVSRQTEIKCVTLCRSLISSSGHSVSSGQNKVIVSFIYLYLLGNGFRFWRAPPHVLCWHAINQRNSLKFQTAATVASHLIRGSTGWQRVDQAVWSSSSSFWISFVLLVFKGTVKIFSSKLLIFIFCFQQRSIYPLLIGKYTIYLYVLYIKFKTSKCKIRSRKISSYGLSFYSSCFPRKGENIGINKMLKLPIERNLTFKSWKPHIKNIKFRL